MTVKIKLQDERREDGEKKCGGLWFFNVKIKNNGATDVCSRTLRGGCLKIIKFLLYYIVWTPPLFPCQSLNKLMHIL